MLHIHRGERADGLAAALSAILQHPLPDPLSPEVVAVPTRGVERWLSQLLAGALGAAPGRRDGVCANVEFPFPGRLVGGAVAAATGVDGDADPWLPERSVWPLLEAVDEGLAEPWLGALAAHLGGADPEVDDARRGRRFGTVRHLADLYDRYAVHRPEMLRAWAADRDVDGSGRPLPAGMAWQAELWRRLRARVATPSPAERAEEACARLRAEPELADLPERFSLFGLTRLPASYLDVLSVLAAGRDVHLFLLHPSPALWTEVAAAMAGAPRLTRRAQDPTTGLARHPLLASWGRDAREMQLVLGADEGPPPVGPPAEAPTTLLRRLQAEIRADRPPPGLPFPGRPDGRPLLEPGDRSLQVHACHGRARQVEVVRDAVLHALADDPTLEPRDVIVMCPDIETFAPLVHATFGAAEAGLEEGAPDLRVRLADRSLRQTNPVLGVASELIELASARVTASQVQDLAGREPVRRRFRLDDDDLVRIEEWVAAAGVRWGLDARHREPFRLESVAANTWRAGLDRVLVGVAMAEEGERLVSGVLPLDDVESGAIDLVGRLAELLERLDAALEALRRPQPVGAWVRAVAAAADALTATGDDETWQRAQLDAVLEQVRTEAEPEGGARASEVVLALPEVRALLADRLRGRPTRANFRTGHLTVCTLVPMRSVPHRVVCLLGLDDGAFPRQVERDGDDIILADPHVGDRDARGEDRQLLLDALFAASDRLVVTYTGRDERTNAERTPAVPIGELLDVVDRTVRTEEAGADGAPLPARERVLVRHPLQPFDPRNFTPGVLLPGGPWSFDPVAMDGARALIGPRAAPKPFLTGPLAPAPEEAVEVERLVRFAQHPVRAFLRRRLGVTLVEGADDAEDALPVELDALERWGVGDRLLRARLGGADPEAAVAAERARGLLPPGALARPVLEGATAMVDRLAAAALDLGGSGEATSVEVDVRLRVRGGERRLVGSVPELRGGLLRTATYSRVGAKHRLAAWVRLLAVAVARPGEPVEAVTIGRGRSGSLVCVARLVAPDGGEAREHLAALVDLHDRGMREPLPLYCKTSAAYAEALAGGADPARAAANEWESRYRFDGECAEPEHLLVLGGEAALVDLLAAPPGPDDDGSGWEVAEETRLGRYARRLWDGLLAHEAVVER